MSGGTSSRRNFLKLIGLGAASLAFSPLAGAVGSGTKKSAPNIILILCDDMGYGDTTVYNLGSKIPTPHMGSTAAPASHPSPEQQNIRILRHIRDSILSPQMSIVTNYAGAKHQILAEK